MNQVQAVQGQKVKRVIDGDELVMVFDIDLKLSCLVADVALSMHHGLVTGHDGGRVMMPAAVADRPAEVAAMTKGQQRPAPCPGALPPCPASAQGLAMAKG